MVPMSEGLELQVHTRQKPKHQTPAPTREKTKTSPSVRGYMGEIQIEMEVFSPSRVTGDGIKLSCSSPVISPYQMPPLVKASSLKWKRLTWPKTKLVVKDVVCLPRDHYLAQMDRHIAPRGKAEAALAAMGMTARITFDNSWTASQMECRLVAQFQGNFLKCLEQKFSFTYLQCLQGSGVLFVPAPPAEGWTAEQVLGMTGHCPLYILSHLDYPKAESGSTPTCVENGNACSIKDLLPVTSAQRRPLTLEEFRQLFDICYSCPSDNLRAVEEKTVAHWDTVLTLINEGRADFSLEDLLTFITGADRLPPGGFSKLVCLRFYSQVVTTSRARLPYASTSTLDLFLPRGVVEAEDLLVLLSRAVHRAPGSARIQKEGGDNSAQK
ncbi:uncharacterized protein LOC117518352 isoform X2 [Thalassophryne amazonica]|nr:uncharacterized protein LOC117518352 isoform X2 [Thalassophryne amazonica]